MKKMFLILCFLALPVLSYPKSLNTALKNIVTIAWDYGYNYAKSYNDCVNLAVNSLNKANISDTSIRLFYFKLVNSSCKIGINDRIENQNHLDRMLKEIDIYVGRK